MSTEAMREKEESYSMKVGERRMNFLTQTDCVLQGYLLPPPSLTPHNVINLVQIENVELACSFPLTLSPWQRKSNYARAPIIHAIAYNFLYLRFANWNIVNPTNVHVRCNFMCCAEERSADNFISLFHFIFHCYSFSLGGLDLAWHGCKLCNIFMSMNSRLTRRLK